MKLTILLNSETSGRGVLPKVKTQVVYNKATESHTLTLKKRSFQKLEVNIFESPNKS